MPDTKWSNTHFMKRQRFHRGTEKSSDDALSLPVLDTNRIEKSEGKKSSSWASCLCSSSSSRWSCVSCDPRQYPCPHRCLRQCHWPRLHRLIRIRYRQTTLYVFLLLVIIGFSVLVLFATTTATTSSSSGTSNTRWHHLLGAVPCLFPSTTFFISAQCGFHPEWHPLSRNERFPSVEDRVKLYMSTWYLPPCSLSERLLFHYLPHGDFAVEKQDTLMDSRRLSPPAPPPPPRVQIMQYALQIPAGKDVASTNKHQISGVEKSTGTVTNITLSSVMKPDTIFVLNENGFQKDFGRYPQDAKKMLDLFHQLFPGRSTTELPPIVITLGDDGGSHFAHYPIPYFCKWRPAVRPLDLKSITTAANSTDIVTASGTECIESMKERGRRSQKLYDANRAMYAPIIWGVSYRRHYRYVHWVTWYDSSWEKKKHAAIWRGVLTGAEARIVEGDSFLLNCQRVPRCQFVMKFKESSILNVGVSFQLDPFRVTNAYSSSMVKGTVSLKEMMKYKAIIILEGNDVASGLKWALYSRSVVMMPEPTKTSYAMEELLVPWVHYVPLRKDGSDAEEKMRWVLEHDKDARKIAERATLFMHDLLFHEQSGKDNRDVENQILSRYYSLYHQQQQQQ